VDEVDVCVEQRLKGVGSLMMRWLIEFARDEGCDEVWLGTEVDNDAANALYRRLEPDDVGDVVGYTWEVGA
jgi:ribosomal protein S18 acetylase RimI-like enzyme